MDKKIVFTNHALKRIEKRGTNKDEVIEAIEFGKREQAKGNKIMCRPNFS